MTRTRLIFVTTKLLSINLTYQSLKSFVNTKLGGILIQIGLGQTTIDCTLKFALKTFDPANALAVNELWEDSEYWVEPFRYWVSPKSLQIGSTVAIGSAAKEVSKAILQQSGKEGIEPEWYVPIKLFSKYVTKGICTLYAGPDGGLMCSFAGGLVSTVVTNYWKGKDFLTEADIEHTLIITTYTNMLSYALDNVDEYVTELGPFARAYYHSIGTGLLRIITKPAAYFECIVDALSGFPGVSREELQSDAYDSSIRVDIPKALEYKENELRDLEVPQMLEYE